MEYKNAKVASITMIKNESDIIEFFIRYNLKFIDTMYIIDHMSVDKSIDILKLLKKEGLPIKIMRYNSYAYDQHKVLSDITNEIKAKTDMDYVLFLDADEFIGCKSKEEFSEKLLKDRNTSYVFNEFNYYLTRNNVEKLEPLYSKLLYREKTVNLRKVMINLNINRYSHIAVTDGGHTFLPGGEKPNDDIYLYHVPCRSKEQMKSKILLGCLSYLIRDVRMKNGAVGHHWFRKYKEFINNSQQIEIPIIEEGDEEKYIYEPLEFKGELLYTPDKIECFENCIRFFQDILEYNDESDKYDIINIKNSMLGESEDDKLIKLCTMIEVYIGTKNNFSLKDSTIEEI